MSTTIIKNGKAVSFHKAFQESRSRINAYREMNMNDLSDQQLEQYKAALEEHRTLLRISHLRDIRGVEYR